jgi:hypothetical protein
VVGLALSDACLLSKVVGLPGVAGLLHWRAFEQCFIPKSLPLTFRLVTSPSFCVEQRILRSALTSVVFLDIGYICFALIDAVLGSKVIDLRNSTSFCDRRTFRLGFVPQRPLVTRWIAAFSCF